MVGPSKPYIGGMVSFVDGLCESSLKDRFQLKIFNVNKIKNLDINGIEKKLVVKLLTFIKLIILFVIELIKYRPDLVHIHTSSYLGFLEKGVLVLVSKLFGCKTVLHIHGGGFKNFYNKSKFKKIIEIILNSPSTVVVLSDMWFQWFSRIMNDSKLVVIPNGVSTFENSSLPPNNKMIFLYLGKLVKEKGIFEIIEAAKILEKESETPFKIILAGDGRERNSFEEKVSTNNQCHIIEFAGVVVGDEKERVLNMSDCFLLPSYNEAMPISLLEAMGSGQYVIASNVGSIPEIISGRNNGIIVKPKSVESLVEAMKAVIENESFYRELGKKNKNFINENFSWNKTIYQIENLYKTLLKN